MSRIPIQIRQGDVFLEAVAGIPGDALPVPVDPERGHVLAEGEVTGHSHRIPHRYAGNAAKYRTELDAQFLRTTAPVPLRHEEHKTVCALCPAQKVGEVMPLATHRIADCFGARDYRCEAHAALASVPVVALAEPGATDLPSGQTFRRTIQLEYVPRAVPRRVED